MNACTAACGYCGACSDGPKSDSWIWRECRSCHREFRHYLTSDEPYCADPLCDTCYMQRDDYYRRERAGGAWPW